MSALDTRTYLQINFIITGLRAWAADIIHTITIWHVIINPCLNLSYIMFMKGAQNILEKSGYFLIFCIAFELDLIFVGKKQQHTFCVSKRKSRKLPFSMKGRTTWQSRLSIETPIIFRTFGWSRPLVIVASWRKSSISSKLIWSSEI